MNTDAAHIHKFDIPFEQKVTLRKYVKEEGRPTADLITAIDKVKAWKCKCGKVIAYNLERKRV